GGGAGGGGEVEADAARHRQREVIEGVLELEAPARDVFELLLEPQLDVLVEELSRLFDAVVAGHHRAGEDQGLRLRARFRQTALVEEHVGAPLHRLVSVPAPDGCGGTGGPISEAIFASSRSMSIGLEK